MSPLNKLKAAVATITVLTATIIIVTVETGHYAIAIAAIVGFYGSLVLIVGK